MSGSLGNITFGRRAPSKASASTLCQKCLKRGHFTYECNASLQERPYVARPSRTQQFLNPKLRQKLTDDEPNKLLQTEGVADEQLAQARKSRQAERSRERQRSGSPRRRQSRSDSILSSLSSDSASSISTNKSMALDGSRSRSASRDQHRREHGRARKLSESVSPRPTKRRRESPSPSSLDRSIDSQESRNIRRRHKTFSPAERGRRSGNLEKTHRQRSVSSSPSPARSRSHSPADEIRRYHSPGKDARQRQSVGAKSNRHQDQGTSLRSPPRRRERSLSPYSRRLALTQTMNLKP